MQFESDSKRQIPQTHSFLHGSASRVSSNLSKRWNTEFLLGITVDGQVMCYALSVANSQRKSTVDSIVFETKREKSSPKLGTAITILWKIPKPSRVGMVSAIAVKGDLLVLGDANGSIHCIYATDVQKFGFRSRISQSSDKGSDGSVKSIQQIPSGQGEGKDMSQKAGVYVETQSISRSRSIWGLRTSTDEDSLASSKTEISTTTHSSILSGASSKLLIPSTTFYTELGGVRRIRFAPSSHSYNVIVLCNSGEYGVWDLEGGARVSLSFDRGRTRASHNSTMSAMMAMVTEDLLTSTFGTRDTPSSTHGPTLDIGMSFVGRSVCIKGVDVDWANDQFPLVACEDGCIRVLDLSLSFTGCSVEDPVQDREVWVQITRDKDVDSLSNELEQSDKPSQSRLQDEDLGIVGKFVETQDESPAQNEIEDIVESDGKQEVAHDTIESRETSVCWNFPPTYSPKRISPYLLRHHDILRLIVLLQHGINQTVLSRTTKALTTQYWKQNEHVRSLLTPPRPSKEYVRLSFSASSGNENELICLEELELTLKQVQISHRMLRLLNVVVPISVVCHT